MFTGLVETQSQVLSVSPEGENIRILVEAPSTFDDIGRGDSICVNGVCLTVEEWDSSHLSFVLAPETLRVTGWTEQNLQNAVVNLERSLKFGDRIHGHIVTGHVDGLGQVVDVVENEKSLEVTVSFGPDLSAMIWKKGSVTINGVSLTLNTVMANTLSVCLIPETLKVTNLKCLKVGQNVNIEVDYMARGLAHWAKNGILGFDLTEVKNAQNQ